MRPAIAVLFLLVASAGAGLEDYRHLVRADRDEAALLEVGGHGRLAEPDDVVRPRA